MPERGALLFILYILSIHVHCLADFTLQFFPIRADSCPCVSFANIRTGNSRPSTNEHELTPMKQGNSNID